MRAHPLQLNVDPSAAPPRSPLLNQHEFTAKAESLCMCVCSHIWVLSRFAHPDECGDHRPRKNKSQGEKTKGEFGFFMLFRISKRTERKPKLILSTFYRGTEEHQIVSRRRMGRGEFVLHFEKAAFLYVATQVST